MQSLQSLPPAASTPLRVLRGERADGNSPLHQRLLRLRAGLRRGLPAGIQAAFDEPISLDNNSIRRVYLSLGQFSILRLERDSQLLIPMYDYCMPTRECAGGDEDGDDDPCEIFRQIRFPVGEFFPPSTLPGMEEEENCGGGASCSCCR